jgi:hypothetical protein
VVAPNVGDYQESVEADFTKPPEGTGGTTTSAGVGGDTGGGGGFAPATPNLTPQQQTQRFDDMVAAEASKLPTPAASFEKTDFDDYINRRTPGDQGTGIMGKAADAVDNFAGFVLSPMTGIQDKKIRETAANRLLNKQYTSQPEYESLIKTVNLSPYGDEKDDGTLADTIAKAKKETFDEGAADRFSKAKVAAKEEMSAPVIFKEDTPVDKFLKGTQRTEEQKEATIEALKDTSGMTTEQVRELDKQRASDAYNDSLRQQRDAEMDRLMNPVVAAERMRMQLGGGDTSQMSGAEREQEQRRQEDAARRAAQMDERIALSARQRAESSSDSGGGSGGGDSGSGGGSFGGGGGGGGSDDKIVCTEMYRQTQLVDWQKAMKVWDIYQRRHLTPEHQVGYHWLFRPYVTGMQSSNILTRLGAFMARKRTQHLKHILTKGKAKDDLFGNVFCKLIHPTVYIAGKIKTFLTKI